eukprot:TRINITY_DN87703_c0_g1_i1.p1 TRINITY_DN87703_c0_g1~~TRINITY_DN87703_c0_g1_i1.p1  ORF type:complete len:433 (+),score=60.04 TRINITY_DN87703_c0_g1_i1:1-1299(+)
MKSGAPQAGVTLPPSFAQLPQDQTDLLLKEIAEWKEWRYPKLRFYVLFPQPDTSTNLQTPPDTTTLGDLVADSLLSVPEIRELILHLQPLVENVGAALSWGFSTCFWEKGEPACTQGWETGRRTSVFLRHKETQEAVEFRVEGQRALKGKHKRDGPLWSLQGGLNNPQDKQKSAAPQNATEEQQHPTELTERDSEGENTDEDYGEEEEEDEEMEESEGSVEIQPSAPEGGKAKGKKDRGKDKKRRVKHKPGGNIYQRKRGVVFTEKYVLFAGTVWCSSYHRCNITLNGVTYTSVAQWVLAEQARVFKDEERLAGIMDAADDPSPHKAYDHKAPKTGIRKVKNFDPAVWEACRDNIMFTGTVAKFQQNSDLRIKLEETVGRTIVEATDDPLWGIGITLNNLEDATNPRKWRGPNLMGKMLERVREEVLGTGGK